MSSTMYRGVSMLGLLIAVGGCASQKGKAEAAVAVADSSLALVAAEAQAYVPTQYEAAGAAIAAAKADLDSGTFATALTKAQEATTLIESLAPAIEVRKGELTQTWQGMSEAVPGMVQAIQTRVDELSKMRRLPAGVTKDAVAQATAALQEMTANWAKAMEAQGQGDLPTATSLASQVQAKAAQVMTTLGMPKA